MFKPVENTFLYFAYGSNLLKRRIHINNPSAEFLGNGRLDEPDEEGQVGTGLCDKLVQHVALMTHKPQYDTHDKETIIGHLLDFIKYSANWRGTSATIVPKDDSVVWGAVWRLNNDDMPALDKQEGVDTNWYFPKTVDIVIADGSKVACRTYQQTIAPPLRQFGEELPEERRPCITYLNCIIQGAIECNLPEDYIAELKKIPNNGQIAPPEMIEKLNRSV